MKKTVFLFFIASLLILTPSVTQAVTDWQALKTEYFTIFYKPGFETQATEVLQVLEYYRPEVEKLTGNQKFHLPIVIDDMGIMANGSANPYFYQVHLFCYPPESGHIGTVEDWNAMVAVHEYTHILQMTNVTRWPKLLCSVFGNALSPNTYVPGWVYEGITVYSESRLWGYQGRLNDGEYDAYIGARVRDGRFPSLMNATFAPDEFSLDGIYTYGGVFFNYLAGEYGEEKITEFFVVRGSSWDSLDLHAERVFGKSFPELWADWQAYETQRFADFYIDGEQVTDCGWSVLNPVFKRTRSKDPKDAGKLYYKKSRPIKTGAGNAFSLEEIIERDLLKDEERVVVSTTSSFALPIKVVNDQLYYGVYELKTGYANALNQGYGAYALLREKNLVTGEDRLLFSGAIRTFEVLPDGRILYVEALCESFGSKIYLYDPAAGGRLLYEVDYLIDEITANGEKIILSARKNQENNDLYLFSINTGELIPLFKTPYAEYGISLVGERVFFNANYDQVYAIYCYDLTEEEAYKLTAGGYAIHPAYHESTNGLYFVGLNSYGFDLYRKDAVFAEYELPIVPPEVWPDFSTVSMEVERGNYWDNLKTLTPKIMAPYFHKDVKKTEAGLIFLGSDAIGSIPQYQIGVFYDFEAGVWQTNSTVMLNLFPPFLATLGYNTYEERPLYLDLNYPLLTRMSPGISGVSVGSVVNYGEDYGTEFIPYTTLNLQYPSTKAYLKLEIPMEDHSWGAESERIGYYGQLAVEQLFFNGQLSLGVKGIYDPDNKDEVFPKIRGYLDPLNAKKGSVYTLEYSKPLLRIRNGFWSWDLYFEDLCASVFVDGAVPDRGEDQLAYGIELYQELKCGSGILSFTLYPGIGIAYNRDGDKTYHLVLKGLN